MQAQRVAKREGPLTGEILLVGSERVKQAPLFESFSSFLELLILSRPKNELSSAS